MVQSATDPFPTLLDAARQLGDSSVESALVALRQRVEEGRFFVACFGQFKRGKSTLLNALIGDAILPVGVLPVTAVVTVLRYGSERRVRLSQQGKEWREIAPYELAAYITEEQNPGNAKHVEAVEIYEPSALLASGMCLVDTPGLGSVFAGNTAATRDFLPHIDAALLVVGADPPISGDELAFARDVACDVRDLVVVLNKADRMSAADVEQARSFTGRVLGNGLGRNIDDILCVSAIERMTQGPSRDWTALEARLTSLARNAGADLVEVARRRGIGRAVDCLVRDIEEHRAALERPMEESMRRLEMMTREVEDAERAVRHLEYLFRAEEDAIRRSLEARRDVFTASALPEATGELTLRLESTEMIGATLRAHAFELAQEIARVRVTTWVDSIRPEAEEMYRRVTSRFVEIANGLLRRLKATGDEALAGLPEELDPQVGFCAASHFFFTDLLSVTQAAPTTVVLDALRSRESAIASVSKRASPYLERLIETNSARVTNDLLDRVRESGRRLRAELVSLFQMTTVVARQAMDAARRTRENGQGAVNNRLASLARLEQTLRRLP